MIQIATVAVGHGCYELGSPYCTASIAVRRCPLLGLTHEVEFASVGGGR